MNLWGGVFAVLLRGGKFTVLKRWLLAVVAIFALAVPLVAFGVEYSLQGEGVATSAASTTAATVVTSDLASNPATALSTAATETTPTPSASLTATASSSPASTPSPSPNAVTNTFIALGEQGAPSGTPEDPFLISTEEDLVAFATSVNGKRVTNGVWEDTQLGAHDYAGLTVQLAQDITLSSAFTPIGIGMNMSASVATPICFSGIFDGQGHTISGLYFTNASNPSLTNSNYHGAQWFSALFGAVKDASVINVVVQLSSAATFSVSTLSAEASAGLIAQVVGGNTIVSCCGVEGDLTGTSSHLGGVVGRVEGGTLNMSYCYHQGKLVTASSGGGLVNCASSATVKLTSCYQAGQVSSTNTSTYASRFFGQLVGTGSTYTLTGCVASSTDDLAGGNAKTTQTGCLSGIEAWNTDAVQGALGSQYFRYGADAATLPELVATAQPGYIVSFSVGSDVAGTRPSSFKAATGTTVTIPTSTLTRKGYVFSGWQISGTAGEADATLYNAGDSLSMTRGNLNFEAVWTLAEAVEISTEAELRSFAEGVNAGTIKTDNLRYVLTHDILLTSAWTPIGCAKHPFEGIFDGQGHVVRGMQVTDDSLFTNDSQSSSTYDTYAGFFGYVSGADIKNLGVEGTIDVGTATFTGGLVGATSGSAATSSKPEDMTSVSTCYANVTISSGGIAAGLAGRSTRTSFADCYTTGSVSLASGGKAVGGLVGYYQSASFSDTSAPAIQRCFSVSTVTATDAGACAGNVFGKVSEYYAKCDSATSWARAIEVYALASALPAYYTESNNGDLSQLSTEFESLYEKSSEDMKAAAFLESMGSAFLADSSDETLQKNNGFPILAWQQGASVQRSATIGYSPASATVVLVDSATGEEQAKESQSSAGSACYLLDPTHDYTVTVSATGYTTKSATINAGNDETKLSLSLEPIVYKISYTLYGGAWSEGYSAPQTYTVEDEVSLPGADVLAKEGYEFLGWKKSLDASDYVTAIPLGTVGDISLLAWWHVLAVPVSVSTTPFATAGSEALYLVTYTGDVSTGNVPTIKGKACYWNGSAYVTLMTRAEAEALVYADVSQVEGSAPQATSSDVNGDGSPSIVDAQIAYDLGVGRYSGFDKLDCGAWLRADVNKDGCIDAADARAIQTAIHGSFGAQTAA